MALTWGTPEYALVVDLCTRYLRPPDRWDDALASLVWEPPLTVGEQAVYARLQRAVRSAVQGITPDEWLAIEDDLAALRTFRQQTQAQFMALTATQRDRALFDVINAQTNVLRALLRD